MMYHYHSNKQINTYSYNSGGSSVYCLLVFKKFPLTTLLHSPHELLSFDVSKAEESSGGGSEGKVLSLTSVT